MSTPFNPFWKWNIVPTSWTEWGRDGDAFMVSCDQYADTAEVAVYDHIEDIEVDRQLNGIFQLPNGKYVPFQIIYDDELEGDVRVPVWK